jgi:hypothetical protein
MTALALSKLTPLSGLSGLPNILRRQLSLRMRAR